MKAALDRLVAAELVFQRSMPPDAVYTFKHALVQDAAHSSLLRSSRQRLHARIAEALENDLPDMVKNQPELLAQHYAEAGFVEKSVAFWGKAGHRSAARSAMTEASVQFHKGLGQLALLPDEPPRRRQELEFNCSLCAVLNAAKGNAAPETGRAHARARELWEQLGSPSEFLHVPYGQARYHAFSGELDEALRLDEDLLRLSHQRSDPDGLVLGNFSSGRDLMFAGRFVSSRLHFEAMLALYDPIIHKQLVRLIGSYPQVASGTHLAIVLFCLGFPDQALARSDAAITEARTLVHPPTLAQNLAMATRLLSLGGDDSMLNDRTDQLVTLANEQGFPLWRAQGTIYRGWVKVKGGDVAEGICLLRSGSRAYRATGAEAWMPHFGVLLAALKGRESAGWRRR